MKIKSLSKADMPREKLHKYGAKKLLDHELLAIILGSGTEGLNVLQLSKKILDKISKIGADKIGVEDLKNIKGLGNAKVAQVLATIQLGERLHSNKQPEIADPEDIWKYCFDLRGSKKEHFVGFYLDAQYHVIERRIISIGTLDTSLVHPRDVFEPAVRLSAAFVAVAHNHPSGSLAPSQEDTEITKRLINAGTILDIALLDHVILTRDSFKSILRPNE